MLTMDIYHVNFDKFLHELYKDIDVAVDVSETLFNLKYLQHNYVFLILLLSINIYSV